MHENNINILKEKTDITFKLVFSMWLMFVLFLGIIYFTYDVTDEIRVLNNLNSAGGFFNIVTSLTGVATVYLLSKAVILQKQEFTNMHSLMENQEKINRTIDLIHKWTTLDDIKYVDDPSQESIESRIWIGPNKINFINHLMLIYTSSDNYTNKIDFNLICQAIKKDNSIHAIKTRISHNKSTLKLGENNRNQWTEFDDLNVEKIDSLEEDEVFKYFLRQNISFFEMIKFIEKVSSEP